MNTFQKLIYQLESNKEDRKKIIDLLGYKDYPKGSNKLLTKLRKKTISKKDLELIAKELKLDSEEIIIDFNYMKEFISKEQKYIKEIVSLKEQIRLRDNFKPYIYIETSEKRPSSIAIVALIYEKIKFIKNLPDNLLELSREEQKAIIKNIINSHYEQKNGVIFLFGNIIAYKYYYSFNDFIDFYI